MKTMYKRAKSEKEIARQFLSSCTGLIMANRIPIMAACYLYVYNQAPTDVLMYVGCISRFATTHTDAISRACRHEGSRKGR